MACLAISAGQAFDGRSTVRDPVTIIVRDGVIEVFGATAAVRIPPDAQVLDFPDATLLPGLIDAHLHLSRDGEPDYMSVMLRETPQLQALKAYAYARKTLLAGYTTVRTAGEKARVDIALKQAVSRGLVDGPRIHAVGKVLGVTGGHRDGYFSPEVQYEGNSTIVNGADSVRAAVREELKMGADWIKLIVTGGMVSPTEPELQQMADDEIIAATTEASRLRKRTAAHAHGAQGIRAAVAGGVTSIEHGTFLDEETAELMIQRGAYLVPTLAATKNLVDRGPEMGVAKFAVEKARRSWDEHQRSFQLALRVGVQIAAGSDAGGTCCFHGDNVTELELMVSLGMKPKEALVAATSVAAELLGVERMVGRLAAGFIGDLVVVHGDPTSDVQQLRQMKCVVRDGRIVYPAGEHGLPSKRTPKEARA